MKGSPLQGHHAGVPGLGRPHWPQRGEGRGREVLQPRHHEHRPPRPHPRPQRQQRVRHRGRQNIGEDLRGGFTKTVVTASSLCSPVPAVPGVAHRGHAARYQPPRLAALRLRVRAQQPLPRGPGRHRGVRRALPLAAVQGRRSEVMTNIFLPVTTTLLCLSSAGGRCWCRCGRMTPSPRTWRPPGTASRPGGSPPSSCSETGEMS